MVSPSVQSPAPPLRIWRPSRARQGTLARTLSRGELEERLDTLLRRSGADAFRRLRDDIRAIALALALDAEAQALDQLMGTLLGTYDAPLSSPVAKARSKGRPYDPDRLTLFETLRKTLSDYPSRTRIARPRSGAAQTTIDFFDAYFSNFIGGRVHEVPVSEVHPFADGNGRTARIMMNAELIAAGQERRTVARQLR